MTGYYRGQKIPQVFTLWRARAVLCNDRVTDEVWSTDGRRTAFRESCGGSQDPSTDAESLRQLAYRYPELRPLVAAHPHAYRGLLEWLHQFNDPPGQRGARGAR